MKRYVIWAVIVASLVLSVVVLNRTSGDIVLKPEKNETVYQQPKPGEQPGRWQIVSSSVIGGDTLLLDTCTGRVFQRLPAAAPLYQAFWGEEKVIGR